MASDDRTGPRHLRAIPDTPPRGTQQRQGRLGDPEREALEALIPHVEATVRQLRPGTRWHRALANEVRLLRFVTGLPRIELASGR